MDGDPIQFMRNASVAQSSREFQIAVDCLGGRRTWRGQVRGLLGLLRRSFTIESEGALQNGELIFREAITFDDGEKQHREWLIASLEQGLEIAADGVQLLGARAQGNGRLLIDYRLKVGRLRVVYRDRFDPRANGCVDNVGRVFFLGMPIMKVTAVAEPSVAA